MNPLLRTLTLSLLVTTLSMSLTAAQPRHLKIEESPAAVSETVVLEVMDQRLKEVSGTDGRYTRLPVASQKTYTALAAKYYRAMQQGFLNKWKQGKAWDEEANIACERVIATGTLRLLADEASDKEKNAAEKTATELGERIGTTGGKGAPDKEVPSLVLAEWCIYPFCSGASRG